MKMMHNVNNKAQYPLHQFSRNFPLDGEVANKLATSLLCRLFVKRNPREYPHIPYIFRN